MFDSAELHNAHCLMAALCRHGRQDELKTMCKGPGLMQLKKQIQPTRIHRDLIEGLFALLGEKEDNIKVFNNVLSFYNPNLPIYYIKLEYFFSNCHIVNH